MYTVHVVHVHVHVHTCIIYNLHACIHTCIKITLSLCADLPQDIWDLCRQSSSGLQVQEGDAAEEEAAQ